MAPRRSWRETKRRSSLRIRDPPAVEELGGKVASVLCGEDRGKPQGEPGVQCGLGGLESVFILMTEFVMEIFSNECYF